MHHPNKSTAKRIVNGHTLVQSMVGAAASSLTRCSESPPNPALPTEVAKYRWKWLRTDIIRLGESHDWTNFDTKNLFCLLKQDKYRACESIVWRGWAEPNHSPRLGKQCPIGYLQEKHSYMHHAHMPFTNGRRRWFHPVTIDRSDTRRRIDVVNVSAHQVNKDSIGADADLVHLVGYFFPPQRQRRLFMIAFWGDRRQFTEIPAGLMR